MGTRSATGVRFNGRDMLAHNQFDGYPSGIGDNILSEIREGSRAAGGLDEAIAKWKDLAGKLKIVTEEGPKPTAAEVKQLRQFADTSVSTRSLKEWYVLLRGLQGSIIKRLESGYLLDASEFITDSLFCEFAYILNLDEETLEIYKGFQKDPDKITGRYKDWRPGPEAVRHAKEINVGPYYAWSLIATIPLAEISQINALQPYLENIGALPLQENAT